jgi:hypothetical protein
MTKLGGLCRTFTDLRDPVNYNVVRMELRKCAVVGVDEELYCRVTVNLSFMTRWVLLYLYCLASTRSIEKVSLLFIRKSHLLYRRLV